MFCSKCGAKLQEGVQFCSGCGTRVESVNPVQANVDEIKSAENVIQQPQQTPVATPGFAAMPSQPKKSHKKVIVIAVAAVCLLIAATIGIVIGVTKHGVITPFLDSGASYKNYDNSFNMSGDLYVARNDKYIFYINSNGFVVRMDADGRNRKVVIDRTTVDRIQLHDKQLIIHSSKDFGVYSTDFDGENLTKLVAVKTSWFAVVKDNLYYIDGYYMFDEENYRYDTYGEFSLYKSDLAGNETTKIISYDVSGVSIQDDSIVYYNSADRNIYVTDLDGSNHRTVYQSSEDEPLYSYKVYKNYLFYTLYDTSSDYISGIYRVNLTTNEKEKIIATVPGEFTFWDGKLVYVADSNSSSSKMYICELDGSNKKEFSDTSVRSPLSMGDYIYYRSGGISSSISSLNAKTFETFDFEAERYSNICFTDKYMFFVDENDDCIYRCDLDGSNVIKLTKSDCSYLYTYKNELYYYGYANGYDRENDENKAGIFAHGLFKLDVDGSWCNAVELKGSSNNIFYDDYVYFPSSYDSHLYRSPIDNIDDAETNTPFIRAKGDDRYGTLLFIADDWVYMITYNGSTRILSRLNLMTKTFEKVIEDSMWDVTYHKGRIYYITRDSRDQLQLKSIKSDGTDNKLILKADISEFCILDDLIYYIDSQYGHIYRINIDGTGKKTLDESCCSGLSIHDGKIYYSDIYDSGVVYSMNIDGTGKKQILEKTIKYTEKTDYTTKGIDDVEAVDKKDETKNVEFSADERMNFEDQGFERFLHVMFGKDAIYGSDLLSVQYIGYYEGAPTEITTLENQGKYSYLMENCVLFSTQPFTSSIDQNQVLCGDASGDTLAYRKNCTVLTVRSNEWMAEHVMPYLYYFKNLKWFTYGYCWIGDNVCLPVGANKTGINPHSRYMHDPYDPFYDEELESEYLNDIIGTWYSGDSYREDTFTISSGGKMHVKTEWPSQGTKEEYDLEYVGGVFTDEYGYGFECVLNSYGSMTVYWVSDNSSATFRRIR